MVATLEVKKWKESIEGIKKSNNELTTDERTAFEALSNHWRNGNFEPNKSAGYSKIIKDNLKLHGSNLPLRVHLKDFAALCDKYYTKDAARFREFRQALSSETSASSSTQQQTPVSQRSIPSSQVRIDYSDGYYIGEEKNGKRHGQGETRWSDGSWHRGTYVNDCRYGQGEFHWANGDWYIGMFVDNNRTGQGELHWANGTWYKGAWVNGKRTGQGEYHWTNGTWYIGMFVDNNRTGQGEFHWKNDDWYKGTWVNGKRTGQGTFYIAKEQRTDTGEFLNDVRTGRGMMKWANGNCYEGGWNNIGQHGQGEFHWANGNWYKGTWVNGKRTGYGEFHWANGDWYIGAWIDDWRTGQGTFYSASSQCFNKGEFCKDRRAGNGVIGWSNGDRYEGTWWESAFGSLNGSGWMYYQDGSRKRVKWINGKIIRLTFWKTICYNFVYPTIAWIMDDNHMWWILPLTIFAPMIVIAFVAENFYSVVLLIVIGGVTSITCR